MTYFEFDQDSTREKKDEDQKLKEEIEVLWLIPCIEGIQLRI